MALDGADADTLFFLDDTFGGGGLPAVSSPPPASPLLDADAELLSTLLASPPTHPSDAPLQHQLEPLLLDFFPPSDDDAELAMRRPSLSDRRDSPTSPTDKPALKTKPKRKKPNRSPNYNPNRARNERRHELIYLRQKVAEMEDELGRLQAAAPPLMLAPNGDEAATRQKLQELQLVDANIGPAKTLVQKPRHQPPVWEKIASRQLCERRRAERENERLRIVLETQLKIAKSLEHLLHKRTAMQGFDESGLAKQRRVFASEGVHQSDELVFNDLLRQVHECYHDAEAHFERFGIWAADTPCREARIRDRDAKHPSGGLNMEMFASDVLPFPVHAASKAAWQYFSHDKNHLPYRLYYERLSENMGLPEDTIVENSGLELRVNHTKAIFNLKQVIRRYEEPDRVVIAYSAIAQPVEFADKPVWGCEFREWGCMVLKKPVARDASTYSVLKTCYFITPEFYGNGSDAGDESRNEIIGELTEFVLSSTAATMAAWLQMIENILVVKHVGGSLVDGVCMP